MTPWTATAQEKKKKAGSRTGSVCPWEGGVKRKGAHTWGAPALISGRARGLQQLGGGRSRGRNRERPSQVSTAAALPSPRAHQGWVGRSPSTMGTEGHSGPVKGEGGESQHPYSWRTPAGQRHSNPTVTREGLSDAPVVSCGLVLQNGSADSRLAW